MPLLKKLHQVKFKAFKNRPTSTYTTPADIRAQFGYPAVDEITEWPGEDNDKNLTRLVEVNGYPTRKAASGRRKETKGAQWLLSKASVDSQNAMPLELTKKVDSVDLKAYQEVKKPDGQLWLFQGWAYFTDDQGA